MAFCCESFGRGACVCWAGGRWTMAARCCFVGDKVEVCFFLGACFTRVVGGLAFVVCVTMGVGLGVVVRLVGWGVVMWVGDNVAVGGVPHL